MAGLSLPPEASGPKVILAGDIGSGKTTSLRSLVELGYEVFVLSLEPNIGDILGDIPADKLHWKYVPFTTTSFTVLLKAAETLSTLHYDVIAKMPGVNKDKHQEFYKIVQAADNFVCDRTGESFGNIGNWNANRVFAIDGLSGMTRLAVSLAVGDKPFLEFRDYAAIQWLISNFINMTVNCTKAWVVLTAHTEREMDPVTGRSEVMVSTLGKALAPVIPRYFSDVIYCRMGIVNSAAVWKWDTLSDVARVKTRNLPLTAGLEPNFKLLHENWLKTLTPA